ncbi:MAG: 5'-deoxyadenosine deaminase [Syntrophomonadaceae bacterium]|nr:5'-deoxyadenosine deaminase [Syntrophomonadaceae bacterium]MDD4550148.1 5'-deoxyadenosine deaminase [Syntrophomonadaceae bacterium]
MSILIKNGTLVTMNSNRDIIKGDLLIDGDRIIKIGQLSGEVADQIIDASDKLVIPGLIQTHVHLCQALFRGMADDLELLDWLKERIWPLEGGHDQESLYYSSLLGCAELLTGGTTSIIDMATVHHSNSVFAAVQKAGIRYLGGKCMMDHGNNIPKSLQDSTENSIRESLELINQWQGKENNRIRYAFCPRFAVSCTDELLREIRKLSEQYDIPVHTHASENRNETLIVEAERGMRNVLYLDSLGLCNKHLILAHCIHLNDDEKQVLTQSQTNIVHCPGSNLKLASGIADIPGLLGRGASVSLGADGAPCNNNLSIFVEMRLAALIHKPFTGPTSMPAPQVFEMATLGGAMAMGLEHEIGSLETGKKADVVIVNLDNWHTRPNTGASPYAHLVYQAQASDVYSTIVDGQILVLDGQVKSFDAQEVKYQSEKSLLRVRKRVNL